MLMANRACGLGYEVPESGRGMVTSWSILGASSLRSGIAPSMPNCTCWVPAGRYYQGLPRCQHTNVAIAICAWACDAREANLSAASFPMTLMRALAVIMQPELYMYMPVQASSFSMRQLPECAVIARNHQVHVYISRK